MSVNLNLGQVNASRSFYKYRTHVKYVFLKCTEHNCCTDNNDTTPEGERQNKEQELIGDWNPS